MKLRPTLWRTCRAIACETRVKLLWLIFQGEELSVQELAEMAEISLSNASNQLRRLSSRGLISFRREKMRVIYRAEANESLDAAPMLLDALRACNERNTSFKTVMQMATAFTHERRIEIVNALQGRRKPFHELTEKTGISPSALSRHLDKLERRGFVKYRDGCYLLSTPGNPLGRTLLRLARVSSHD